LIALLVLADLIDAYNTGVGRSLQQSWQFRDICIDGFDLPEMTTSEK